MPIRVTLTGVLEDFWGADEAFADGGLPAVSELIEEDLSALMENLTLSVEQVDSEGEPLSPHPNPDARRPI